MHQNIPITVAYGDGIGPEIMDAVLRIILAAGAKIDLETIDVGEKVYLQGNTSGIEPSAWESLRRTKVFLKSPITTPRGGGYKSLNVTIRSALGLYANVRPSVSYYPFVQTKHPVMDLVIIRENEEDLYTGIEHRQTHDVYQCLKLISRPGSEKIIRYAFEFAKNNNRKKVTCFVKDNIMKLTDGLFHKIFNEIGEEYQELEKDVWIIDVGAAKIATIPETFDVIVMENLYGDIISDVTAEMTGSIGLGGSANIGNIAAMFEAIHGSAPGRAGQNNVNPSGLLLAAILMLVHIDQPETASLVHNAFLKTLEDGIHTFDIFRESVSKSRAGTREFADAIIDRIGEEPKVLKPVSYKHPDYSHLNDKNKLSSKITRKDLVGIDVFLDWNKGSAETLGEMIKKVKTDKLELVIISNRGAKVYPGGMSETFCTDHWRCRYMNNNIGMIVTHSDIIELLNKLNDTGFDFIKTEHLYNFEGEPGYSLAQGQ